MTRPGPDPVELEADLRAEVQATGWAVVSVLPTTLDSRFWLSYTVGRHPAPELCLVGFKGQDAHGLLRVTIEALDATGVTDLAAAGPDHLGLPVVFAPVPDDIRVAVSEWARRIDDTNTYDLWQVLVPDQSGAWPWDPAHERHQTGRPDEVPVFAGDGWRPQVPTG